jgi:hypothetical protein
VRVRNIKWSGEFCSLLSFLCSCGCSSWFVGAPGIERQLRVLVTAPLASNIPMLEHSSVGNGASSIPGTNTSIARVRANVPGLVDAFCICHDASCLSCSLLRGKSREHGISVHHGDDVCDFRSL